MPYDEVAKKATIKYRDKNIKRMTLDLNKNTDSDIIEWLKSVDNKQGYIKDLIRADMLEYSRLQSD